MKKLKWIFLALGATLLAYVVKKTGVEHIMEGIRSLGWRLILVIAVTFPSYVFYTIGWRRLLCRFESKIRFWNLFMIKISGEAANTLTPLNFAGGDPLRVYLLKKTFPVTEGAASVTVDRTIFILATVLMVITGVWAAFVSLPIPYKLRLSLVIGTTVLSVLVAAFFFVQRKQGLFRTISKILSFLKIKKEFSEKTLKNIEVLDQNIRTFYKQHKGRFLFCFAAHYLGRWVGVAEIVLITYLMGKPVTVTTALFLTAVMPLIIGLFSIVPGAFGVLEGAIAAIFYALHYNPAYGVTLQITRRLRALFWILLGLIFVLIHNRGLKKLKNDPV